MTQKYLRYFFLFLSLVSINLSNCAIRILNIEDSVNQRKSESFGKDIKNPRIREVFKEALLDYNINPETITLKRTTDPNEWAMTNSVFKEIIVNEDNITSFGDIFGEGLLYYLAYHEVGHLKDNSTLKGSIQGMAMAAMAACLLGATSSAYCDKIRKVDSNIPVYCAVLGIIGGAVLSTQLEKSCEHRANTLACQKLIAKNKIHAISAYLACLYVGLHRGDKRMSSCHPPIIEEIAVIKKYLSSLGYTIRYIKKSSKSFFIGVLKNDNVVANYNIKLNERSK